MAIPVARVHLAMAHAALPGLLPSPPKCAMLPLLPAPPCAATILLPNNSPPRPSRADAAERWDAHKTKLAGSSPSSSSSAGSPGRASSCEKWVSNKKKSAAAATSCSSSSSSGGSGSRSRADSDERWDAHKKPASTASSFSASRNKGRRGGSSKRRATSRASSSSSGERWDAHKNGRRAPRADGFVDDGESSTGSNDVELDKAALPRAFYAGPGFIVSPAPSMLPMPSFMVRVAA
ncbi:unnamed protein product [Urochloa decumbens]|uniref:Uncharacterized protein n=1 Tax=Urochloa decumbens TaxID=240449 RepID=A0ABC9AXP2_9POAL